MNLPLPSPHLRDQLRYPSEGEQGNLLLVAPLCDRMISVHFQGKTFTFTVIQVYVPTTNAKEVEVEWFHEDLQDLLKLTLYIYILFIIGNWNAKVGRQEITWSNRQVGLGVQNKAGQGLTEFCQENAWVIANTLFQQHKRQLHTWISPDCQY